MIKKDRINGVDITFDDGNEETKYKECCFEVVDISDSPELCAEAEKDRFQFVRRQLQGFGKYQKKNRYFIMDRKTGKEAKELD